MRDVIVSPYRGIGRVQTERHVIVIPYREIGRVQTEKRERKLGGTESLVRQGATEIVGKSRDNETSREEDANKARWTVNRNPERAVNEELTEGKRVKKSTTYMDGQTRVDRCGSPYEVRAINR